MVDCCPTPISYVVWQGTVLPVKALKKFLEQAQAVGALVIWDYHGDYRVVPPAVITNALAAFSDRHEGTPFTRVSLPPVVITRSQAIPLDGRIVEILHDRQQFRESHPTPDTRAESKPDQKEA